MAAPGKSLPSCSDCTKFAIIGIWLPLSIKNSCYGHASAKLSTTKIGCSSKEDAPFAVEAEFPEFSCRLLYALTRQARA
jgi:hypothetical protein